MNPVISIITICKNAGAELGRTFYSVKEQSYGRIEFVFLDGASDDELTKSLIIEHRSMMNVFVSEPDGGIYDAMNKGIKQSKGEWILFLNAGDRLADSYSLEAAARYLNAEIARVFYGDVVWVDTENKIVKAGLPEISTAQDLLQKNFPHSGTFYHRSCFKDFGVFDTSYRILADYELNLRLLLKHRIPFAAIDTLVSVFYTGGISTSEAGREKRKTEQQKIRSEYASLVTDGRSFVHRITGKKPDILLNKRRAERK